MISEKSLRVVRLALPLVFLLLVAGCAGTATAPPSAAPTESPTTSTTTMDSTTTTAGVSRQLLVNARNLDPINVSIRITRYSSDDGPVVNESVPLSGYEVIDYTDRLVDGETYEVIVETPTDTQRHVLRPNQALRFIIKGGGTIEREMTID